MTHVQLYLILSFFMTYVLMESYLRTIDKDSPYAEEYKELANVVAIVLVYCAWPLILLFFVARFFVRFTKHSEVAIRVHPSKFYPFIIFTSVPYGSTYQKMWRWLFFTVSWEKARLV